MNEDATPLDRVLAALTVPAHPGELDGRDRALAAFQEAAARPLPVSRANPVKSARARLLTVKTGLAVLCVTVLGGGVALATGTGLTFPGNDDGKPVFRGEGIRLEPKRAPSTGSPTARPTPSSSPEARLAALCRQILRDEKGRRDGGRGAAYAELAEAAGGKSKVYGYCLSLRSPDAGSKPSGRPGRPSAKPAGRPGDEGARPADRPTGRPGRPDNTARPARPDPGRR
ncbi:hypothetical protein [Actinocorallia aurantiaca]|uniref:DUF5667 domain-containing protein n=1 Tax=Actinocorallia aurantiaca TaxID=46204 RepID=A0ABN3U8P5_9ACTN